MPRSSSKKRNQAHLLNEDSSSQLLDQMDRGMPALDSIIEVTPVMSLKAGTAAAAKYHIIQTNEIDAYELDKTKPEESLLAKAAAAMPTGDNFKGTARKAAKLSKAQAKLEKFDDLKDLIDSLTSDAKMIDLKISTDAKSGRVKEEQRNVQVKAFLYAASREADNDFHLIIGRDPKNSKEMYLTVELSGLPPKSSAAFNDLKAARDSFKKFYKETLGANLPGQKYGFPRPPVPVVVEGSLFFDANHSHGDRPGPQSLKSRMPTIWEVHPITKITFKP
ncbi:MAG: hypothetical protein V7641_3243 [Blastocatellia bacterium]